MTHKLNDCPFCGGEVELDHDGDHWFIFHRERGDQSCYVMFEDYCIESPVDLIITWNTRAEKET